MSSPGPRFNWCPISDRWLSPRWPLLLSGRTSSVPFSRSLWNFHCHSLFPTMCPKPGEWHHRGVPPDRGKISNDDTDSRAELSNGKMSRKRRRRPGQRLPLMGSIRLLGLCFRELPESGFEPGLQSDASTTRLWSRFCVPIRASIQGHYVRKLTVTPPWRIRHSCTSRANLCH